MGPGSPYGTGPGQISSQGRVTAHWEEAKAVGEGEMGVSSAGGSE